MKKSIFLIILLSLSIKISGQEKKNINRSSSSLTLVSKNNNSITRVDINDQNTNGPGNPVDSRDLTGSTVTIVETIVKSDGTVDIVFATNVTSPDVSYADATSYTFPEWVTINSGYDGFGNMPESTGDAVCSITIDTQANTIVFGDASFLADSLTGSGYGCISDSDFQHVVNVSTFTEDITIEYYLADDCYQSCGDIMGELIVPGIDTYTPKINNLGIVPGQDQITLSWDPPPASYENADIVYGSGNFDDHIYMSSGEAVVGTYFAMPLGSNTSSIGSVEVFGVEGASGETVIYGYNIVNGAPEPTHSYDTTITTVENSWTGVELGWSFNGDFLVGMKITTSIGISLDPSSAPSSQSWMNLGSWDTWNNFSEYYELTDGEWGIKAKNVNSNGLDIDYTYNVYRNQDASDLTLVSQNQSSTYYIDNNIESDTEYCYSVTSHHLFESGLSPLVCYNTGTGIETISASVTFTADLSQILNFDPLFHAIEVRGSWDQWGSGNYMLAQGDYYSATVDISGTPGQIMEWQFKAGPDEVWVNDGWELGPVRTFIFSGENLDLGDPIVPNIISWEENLIPEFSLGDSWALPGDTVEIEFSFSSGDETFSMSSYETSFNNFYNSQIEYIGVDTSNTVTGQASWLISTNTENNQILVAAAGSAPITGSGTLFRLRFAIDQNIETSDGEEHQLGLQSFMVNEFHVYDDQGSVSGNIYIADCNSNYVTIYCDNGAYQTEVSWNLYNSSGDIAASGGAPFYQDLCLPDDAYTLIMSDAYGDGWNGNMWGVYDIVSDSTLAITTMETGESASFDFYIGDYEQLSGCTDQTALNFDGSAVIEDGSCLYEGDICSSALIAIEGDDGNNADGGDEWFYYTATLDGFLTITTCYEGQTEDTDLKVFSGCPSSGGYELSTNDDADCGLVTGGNDYASEVTISINAGDTYYIFWDDTWDPLAFTWYMYETAPQTSPSNLTAIPAPGSILLNWDPMPVDFSMLNTNLSLTSQLSVNDVYEQSLVKKEEINSNRPLRSQDATRSSNSEPSEARSLWIERTGRNTSVTVTLYDSYGDGYDGDGYLESENGEQIAVFPGSNWGSELSYGPYDLADGIYTIYFEEALYDYETSWVVYGSQGDTIIGGPVSSYGYFGIGDVEVPLPDITVDSIWYNPSQDIISASISNNGTGHAGGFHVTYFLLDQLDNSCGNDNYEAWSYVDSLSPGTSVNVSSANGVMEYLGGYGTYSISVFADLDCIVNEINESNNTLTQNINIVDPLEGVTWNVYRQESNNDFSIVSVADAVSFIDTGVLLDVDYCYYVTQVNEDSESLHSNTDCASPLDSDVILEPYPSIDFASVKAGMSSGNQIVTIINGSGNYSISIENVSIVGLEAGHFIIDYFEHSEPSFVYDSVQIGVSFSPQSVGQKTAQLQILSASGNMELTLTGSGYLDAPVGLEAYGYDGRVDLSWSAYGAHAAGDDTYNPFVVTELPYVDVGTTEGFTDDYDMTCPYNAPGSPDVVYSFDSPGGSFDIGLCESGYDTKLYIYNTMMESVDCNDDACSNSAGDLYRSLIENVALDEATYYIIVDGYAGQAGDYELTIDYHSSRSFNIASDVELMKNSASPTYYTEYENILIPLYTEEHESANSSSSPATTRDHYDIGHYKIYKTSNPNTTEESFSSVQSTTNEFTDLQVENGIRYYYKITAVESVYGESDFSEIVSVLPTLSNDIPFFSDFESDNGGFISGIGTGFNLWEWGSPAVGPDSAFSGNNVWGTNLDGGYPDNSQQFMYNIFDMSASPNPIFLSMSLWYDLEEDADFLRIVVDHDNDGEWNIIESYTGQTSGWQSVTVAIPEEYRSSYARLGFLLDSDESVNGLGAYVDNFSVISSNPPVIITQSEDIPAATEDQIFSFDIVFTDPDGGLADSYDSEITGPASNWLSVNGIWSIGGTDYIVNLLGFPDDDNLFENTFAVSITDGNGLSSTAGLSIDIIPTNDAPVITAFTGDSQFDEDTQLSLTVFDFTVDDPDNAFPGDFVSQGIFVGDTVGDNYTWDGENIIPDLNYFGLISIPVSVNDGMAQSPLFILNLSVDAVNDAPILAAAILDTVVEESPYEMVINFSDVDASDDIDQFSITLSGSAAGWLEVDTVFALGGGEYGFMVAGMADDEDLMDNLLSVTVSDGYDDNVFDYTLAIVATNDAPVITAFTGESQFDEDTQLSLTVFDFTVDDPDNAFPGDFVSQGVSVGEGDNYTWDGENIIPDLNYFGLISIPVSVNDGMAQSPLFILNLSVDAVNDAPIIVGAIISPEVDEDVQIEIDQDMLDISDVDGENSFTVYAADGENYSVIGENIVVPDPDYNGTVFVPISIQDSSGASSNTIEFSVVFVPVNDAPTITNLELNPSIPELGDDIVLDYVFFDVDGDDESGTSITWYNDGLVQNQFQNQTTIPSSATLCEEVWYAMVVPSDGVLAGEGINTPEAVICGNNTPPVWSSEDIVFSIDEDAADQTFSLADYVSDSEQSTSQLLFSVDDNSDVINLGASFSGSDLVLSALVENYFTEEPIALALIVDDQLGYSDTVSVAVNIDPVNDDPVLSAYNGSLELQEDDSLVISLESLSVQDVDNVFPHDFLLTVSEGDHYTVINSPDDTTSIIYPVQDYNGIINTSVSVSDGELSSNPFDLAITVTPVNDAPVVLAQLSISTEEDVSFMITLDDIIYEDVDNGAEDLSIILSSGENYSVESATVTPSMDYIGLLNIPLHLYDGQDTSLTSFVLEAEVLGVNDAPILVTALEDITVAEDSEGASFSLISNNDNLYFDDIDIVSGDLLSYTVAEAVGGLLLVSSENDSVHIDFMQDSSGTDTLFITASDLSGLSVTDTVVVLVTPVNDAPVIAGVLTEFSMLEDDSITIGLSDIQILDVDSDSFTMSILEGENYTVSGSVIIPTANFNGALSAPITVNDGEDESEPFSLTILVEPVNDAPLGFSLLSPENGATITILASDIINQTSLEVTWLQSIDPDNESVVYGLQMDAADWSSVIISGFPDTSYNVSYAIITAILDSLDASELSIDWTVFSTDGIDTVYAEQVFTFNVDAYDVLSVDEVLIPDVYALHQNYPNPFNPTTTVKYDLPEQAVVTIKIFDVLGREVISLIDNMYQNPGFKSIRWNGLNQDGKQVVSGMYFYVIKTENFSQTRKMLMIK